MVKQLWRVFWKRELGNICQLAEDLGECWPLAHCTEFARARTVSKVVAIYIAVRCAWPRGLEEVGTFALSNVAKIGMTTRRESLESGPLL